MSKYQYGFHKGYIAQHYLIALIEKWKQSVDNVGAFGALMTDLSKEFDCLSNELLIAKLDAFGFDKISLKLVHYYLSNRKQRVKINDPTTLGEKYCMEYHKAQYWELCFSIFLYEIYFISWRIMKLLTMQMTQHLIVLKETISSLSRN